MPLIQASRSFVVCPHTQADVGKSSAARFLLHDLDEPEALRFPPPLLTYQQERGYVGSELTSVPAGKADRKSTLPP